MWQSREWLKTVLNNGRLTTDNSAGNIRRAGRILKFPRGSLGSVQVAGGDKNNPVKLPQRKL